MINIHIYIHQVYTGVYITGMCSISNACDVQVLLVLVLLWCIFPGTYTSRDSHASSTSNTAVAVAQQQHSSTAATAVGMLRFRNFLLA